MFMKYIVPYNRSEIFINKDKIRLIENLSTANNLQAMKLQLNIGFSNDHILTLSFETQDELDTFLQKLTSQMN